jgi:hypothetical protein
VRHSMLGQRVFGLGRPEPAFQRRERRHSTHAPQVHDGGTGRRSGAQTSATYAP